MMYLLKMMSSIIYVNVYRMVTDIEKSPATGILCRKLTPQAVWEIRGKKLKRFIHISDKMTVNWRSFWIMFAPRYSLFIAITWFVLHLHFWDRHRNHIFLVSSGIPSNIPMLYPPWLLLNWGISPIKYSNQISPCSILHYPICHGLSVFSS